MPTQAFFNLNDNKRNEIIEAAKKEFSINLFEKTSINQIIKTINMPRGTFYLYFNNKEDIYDYIFMLYKKELIDIIISLIKKNNGNIFDGFIESYIHFINDEKISLLIKNFFLNMNSRRLDPHSSKENCHHELNNLIVSSVDKDLFLLTKEEHHTLLDILMPLFFHSVALIIHTSIQKEKIKERYIRQITIIRRGLEKEKL